MGVMGERFSPKRSAGSIAIPLILAGALLLALGLTVGGTSLAPYIASRLDSPPALQILPSTEAVGSVALPPTATVTGASAALLPRFQAHAAALPTAPSSQPSPTPPAYPPTRIRIPAIGVDAAIVPIGWHTVTVDGVTAPMWEVPPPQVGGWHETSAPLGAPGNTVINGHNWPEDAVFHDLYRLRPGERVVLYSGETEFLYRVEAVRLLPEAGQPLEVRQANARAIQPTDDERVTLVTCHPYGSLRYRLIVIARPVAAAPTGVEHQ